MDYDVAATFGDDYRYFYEESTDDGHSDTDAAEIIGLLEPPPGSRILDAPCGTGRIARRLAAGLLGIGSALGGSADIDLHRVRQMGGPRPSHDATDGGPLDRFVVVDSEAHGQMGLGRTGHGAIGRL